MEKEQILYAINLLHDRWFLDPTKRVPLAPDLAAPILYDAAIRLLLLEPDRSLHLGYQALSSDFEPIARELIAVQESRQQVLAEQASASVNPSFVFTGIGARKTPANICALMTKISRRLEVLGYTLRSGAAVGADNAFEQGVKAAGRKEIYLPSKGFQRSESTLYEVDNVAIELALLLHPSPQSLLSSRSRFALNAMARNGYQVLGREFSRPSDFVCCYTPDGMEKAASRSRASGGTGQAVMLADLFDIPVYNLANSDAMLRLTDHIERVKLSQAEVKGKAARASR